MTRGRFGCARTERGCKFGVGQLTMTRASCGHEIVFFFPVHPIGREHRAAASSLSELSAPGHAAPDFRPLWNQLHAYDCARRVQKIEVVTNKSFRNLGPACERRVAP